MEIYSEKIALIIHFNYQNFRTMKFRIIYAMDLEIKRVQETVQKLSWYKENKYTISLPNGLKEGIIYEDIFNSVDSEYSDSLYHSTALKIQLELKKENVENQLRDMFLKFELSLPQEIIIQLTRYWTKWSYNPPNEIILHLEQKRSLISVILHETIHLLIHPYIEKYTISHWHKEALVDFLFKQTFPELSFQQSIKENYMNNIESIFWKNENLNFSEKIKKLANLWF